jgi:hypothetical protein
MWHADLAYGGNPVSRTATRKSIVTHHCPRLLSRLFAESVVARLRNLGGHRYTTSHYGGEPLA